MDILSKDSATESPVYNYTFFEYINNLPNYDQFNLFIEHFLFTEVSVSSDSTQIHI